MPIDKGNGTQSWATVLSKSNNEAHMYTVENECIVNPRDFSIPPDSCYPVIMAVQKRSCSSRDDLPTDIREMKEDPERLKTLGGWLYQKRAQPWASLLSKINQHFDQGHPQSRRNPGHPGKATAGKADFYVDLDA
jgi:hypothetical protein